MSAFVVAFPGSVALWWIYFHHSAAAARGIISSSEYPGRLARSAYTYFHLPMIAGIISIAAADELTVAHPVEHGTPASVALILGGTALFLAGHALFKWAVFGGPSFSHVVAIGVLAVLIPVGLTMPTLALSGPGRNRPCRVGDPDLPGTAGLATPLHHVSTQFTTTEYRCRTAIVGNPTRVCVCSTIYPCLRQF